MEVVAGVDLGGTAINYTLVDRDERFLIEQLCEHPALSKQGPEVCLQQIADGLKIATDLAGITVDDVVAIGLDTPGPASAAGQLSARGSTNFVHPKWVGFDIREGLAHKLGKPVSYLNDANAAALWGHYAIFGATGRETSISIVVGTGNGGGIILDGNVVKGKNGFGGELGHVLIPYQSISGIAGISPQCNCGRIGDLESLCSLTAIEKTLLPFYLPRYPGHQLTKQDSHQAAKLVRGLAEQGDPMCKEIFRSRGTCLGTLLRRNDQYVRSRCLDCGGRCSRNESGISALVLERNPRRDANSARGASHHSDPRDAEWRHCRGARRGLGSVEAGEAKWARIGDFGALRILPRSLQQ